MLETRGLDCCVFDGERTGDFSCSSTVHNTVVADKVADNAEGIVERSLGFVDDLDIVSINMIFMEL